jgi:5-methylcytosine-specific restriction endonuclease McrA
MPIPRSMQQQVRERANQVCEYYHLPDALTTLPFQIDHIIAEKHGGPTIPENLAYCCLHCNSFKGPNIAGVDQETEEVVRLFHPRQDTWEKHFTWDGSRLVGRTPIGRVTIAVLAVNAPYRLEIRQALIAEGVFPP